MKNKKMLILLFNIFMIALIQSKINKVYCYCIEETQITLTEAIQVAEMVHVKENKMFYSTNNNLNIVSPNTGDINVAAVVVLSIIFIIGIIYAIKQYRKK